MKLKYLIAICCMATSSVSYAARDRCDFTEREGIEFEFAAPEIYALDSAFVTSNAKVYQNWYESTARSQYLDYDEYYGRSGKIVIDEPVKVVKENSLSNVHEERVVRYYSAIIDNCKHVYMRVIEDDFPQYFSSELDLASEKFDLQEQEMWAGVTIKSNFKKLVKQDIKYVTVRPEGDRKIHFVDLHGTKNIKLPRYTSLKVLDARKTAFYVFGKMLSNYKIEVEYKGEQGYINADYRYLTNNNPLISVRDDYMDVVAKGLLKFGMNPNEVLLSLGLPKTSVSYPVYSTKVGLYTDYRGDYIADGAPLVSYVLKWKYEQLKWPITFNREGVFDEHSQIFNRGSAQGIPSIIVED